MKIRLIALLVLLGVFSYGWVLDFTQGKTPAGVFWWSDNKNLNRCSLEHVKHPSQEGKALRVTWDAGITNYMHVLTQLPADNPTFTRAKGVVTLTTEMPMTVSKCRFRIQDKNYETFYFDKKVDWTQAGRRQLEFDIDVRDLRRGDVSITSHGKDWNKTMDFPLSTCGVSFVFAENGLEQSLLLESVKLEPYSDGAVSADVSGKAYPLVALSEPFIEPFKMPQRMPNSATLERAVNPVTKLESLKMVKNDGAGRFEVIFSHGGSPRGVLGKLLGPQQGCELTVRFATEKPLPGIKNLLVTFIEEVGATYTHKIPVKLDRAGAYRITFELPAKVRTKKPWGTRDWQETAPVVLTRVGFESLVKEPATIYFDGIDMKVSRKPLEFIEFHLPLENVAKVVPHDKASSGVPATLRNTSSLPLSFKVRGTMKDDSGIAQAWSLERDVSLKPGELLSLDTIDVPSKYGVYYVDLELTGAKMEPVQLRRSFVHLKLTGAKPSEKFVKGFKFGCVAHLDPYYYSPKTVVEAADTLSQVGIRILRTDIRGQTSPVYLKHLDHVVDTFTARGMNFDFIMGYQFLKGVENLDLSLSRYEQLFRRYKGRIQYWEMLNEPDLPWGRKNPPTVQYYVELAKKTGALLRSIDDQAEFMSAGFCTLNQGAKGMGPFHVDAMRELKDVFDVHCFHGHGRFERFARYTIENGLLKMRKELGITIPWYANETALTSTGDITEKKQAEALYKKLLYSWSRGAQGFTWYNMRSKGMLTHDGEHNYGMMTWEFYPKAVYAAYNGLTGLFHDKEYFKSMDYEWGQWGIACKSSKDIALCLWNDSDDTVPRMFKTDARSAEWVDMYGNSRSVPIVNGRVFVETQNTPHTLLLRGATDVEALPKLVVFGMPSLLLPGQKEPMTVNVTNPFAEARKVRVSMIVPSDVTCGRKEYTATVSPLGSVSFKSDIVLSSNAKPMLQNRKLVLVKCELEGMVPMQEFHVLPSPYLVDGRLSGEPHFVMESGKDVTQLYVGDPSKEDSTWKSTQDLSARVWLSVDDKALTVKVRVRDDEHCQKNTGTDRAWDGDSVQLFLATLDSDSVYEMDFARREDGTSYSYLRKHPSGVEVDAGKLSMTSSCDAGSKGILTYVITVPYEALGVSASSFAKAFKFNMMVNDSDRGIREGWVSVAPGVGMGTVNVAVMPVLRCVRGRTGK